MISFDSISPFTIIALALSLVIFIYGVYKWCTFDGNPKEEGLGISLIFSAWALAIVSVGAIEYIIPITSIVLNDILL